MVGYDPIFNSSLTFHRSQFDLTSGKHTVGHCRRCHLPGGCGGFCSAKGLWYSSTSRECEGQPPSPHQRLALAGGFRIWRIWKLPNMGCYKFYNECAWMCCNQEQRLYSTAQAQIKNMVIKFTVLVRIEITNQWWNSLSSPLVRSRVPGPVYN